MARMKSIKEACLQELAAEHPEQIGTYDAAKKQLTTPAGDILALTLGKVGRSEAVYVKGDIVEFLKGLDLAELQSGSTNKTAGESGSVSLSSVPVRQAHGFRSWRAWFKLNYQADPEAICAAVRRGFDDAQEDIRKAREAEEKAQQTAADAETLRLLKGLKGKIGEQKLAELLKKA